MSRVRAIIRETALQYPPLLVDAQLHDLPRVEFHVRLLRQNVGRHAAICDLGGGVGVFPTACAALGMKVTLVDDFQQPSAVLALHRHLGVHIVSHDLASSALSFPPNCFDAVTAFDSIESWHSPKPQLDALRHALRPGGVLILAVPNAAPSLNQLRFIAKDLGLRRVRILGRNWLVRRRRTPVLRLLTPLADHFLRLRPSLCANLYLIGHK